MTDMTTYLMLDDVNTTLLEQHAGPAHALAGYVNGHYANWTALAVKYGTSGKFLLSIDVANNPAAGAQCLDIESGDATIADAPAWFRATQAAGKKANDLRYYPKLYTSASNVSALVATMSKAGIARNEYMLWSAHYTNQAHICAPATCGYPAADATQWTSSYQGVSLDASLCYGYFFAGPPTAAAPAPVASKPVATTASTAPKAYKAPADLKAGPSSVRLTWAAPEGASAGDSYQVEVEGMGGKVLYNEIAHGLSITIGNMTPGAEYQFRVRVNTSTSAWSPLVKFTV